MITRDSATSFVWDHGNTDKNWQKHHVSTTEAEEPFFDPNRKEFGDPVHSSLETRHIVVGETKTGRLLYVAYTLRRNKIRVISARSVNKKERSLYEKTT
jgi:hypothetical protein